LYEYQSKRLSKKEVCKLLKIKGRFAQRACSDAPCRGRRASQSTHTPRGKTVSISNKRTCKNGMLEVVENKGANLRFEKRSDAFEKSEGVG
jgi:hypothetical protein